MNYKQTVFEKLIDKQIASDNFLSDTRISILKEVAIKVASAYEELADEEVRPAAPEYTTIYGRQYYTLKQPGCDDCAFYDKFNLGECNVPEPLSSVCVDKNIVWKPYVE